MGKQQPARIALHPKIVKKFFLPKNAKWLSFEKVKPLVNLHALLIPGNGTGCLLLQPNKFQPSFPLATFVSNFYGLPPKQRGKICFHFRNTFI